MANGFEEKIILAFDELEVPDEERGSLNACLGMMKGRDKPTYMHCARVGLTGREVAEFMHQDPKILFYPGILHDFGKILTNPGSLKKNEGFNDKDMKELEKHPKEGYQLLKEIHPMAAEILLRHHQFQENPYPARLPDMPSDFSRGEKVMINYYARILSLIDFYDALTTRKNKKWGDNARLPTRAQARDFMVEKHPDQEYFIRELYQAKIF